MNDLDKKLKELIVAYAQKYELLGDTNSSNPYFEQMKYAENFSEQIKQAFIDDGWKKQEPFTEATGGGYVSIIKKGDKLYTVNGLDEIELYDGTTIKMNPGAPKRMTGQEWYDRFILDLYVPPKQDPSGMATNDEARCRFYRDGGSNFMYEKAINAAQEAAGIKQENI